MKSETNEQVLLKRLAENDPGAVQAIYKENFGVIQSFILKNNGSYDDAKDVFQEAIIVLYENSAKEAFELTCKISTYLFSICRRLWLRRLQYSNRFTSRVENLEETVPVEDDIAFSDKRNADFAIMEQSLSSLGEPCKSILESYYLKRKDMAEIADTFGYTNADNAKNQKYKCLIRLKKLFFSKYNRE